METFSLLSGLVNTVVKFLGVKNLLRLESEGRFQGVVGQLCEDLLPKLQPPRPPADLTELVQVCAHGGTPGSLVFGLEAPGLFKEDGEVDLDENLENFRFGVVLDMGAEATSPGVVSSVGAIQLFAENYAEALGEFTKTYCVEGMFISEFCLGRFERALELEEGVLPLLLEGKNLLYATSTEVVFMLFFGHLATDPLGASHTLLPFLKRLMLPLADSLEQVVEFFREDEFLLYREALRQHADVLDASLFISSVKDELVSRMQTRLVGRVVEAYGRIGLGRVREMTGMNEEEVLEHIQKGIEGGVLNGRVDYVEGVYVGAVGGDRRREAEELLWKVGRVQQKMELVEWVTGNQ